jgi:hypothetical protein
MTDIEKFTVYVPDNSLKRGYPISQNSHFGSDAANRSARLRPIGDICNINLYRERSRALTGAVLVHLLPHVRILTKG